MKTVRLEMRPDQVAVLTFDSPDSAVNVLSRETMGDFESALDEVFRDPTVKGCVLTSAKSGCFLAGADLHDLATVNSAKEAEKISRQAQDVFDRIANGTLPFVAAISGVTLGGGLELALACHARVASDSPKSVFALPEVQLGLLPGAGGTQRLPRLVGLRQALPMLLSGARIRAKNALKMKLVDELVGEKDLVDSAANRALRLAGGNKRLMARKLSIVDRALALPLARSVLLKRTRKQVLRKTRGHYPAPLSILECVKAGLTGDDRSGFAKEASLFGELVVSPEAKNLIWIFQASTELKKLPSETPKPHPVEKLAILGAGLMGQGIAQVSLPLATKRVVLKDVSEKPLTKAGEAIQSHATKRGQWEAQKEKLHLTTSATDLKGADLVIEAVFEDLGLKQKVLAETEAVLAPEAVFASNTSALPIAEIASKAKHPERVLGMHYFSPVPKMPLLEIIVTPQTSKLATATAQAYGIAQGKTVIVVKDGPGFYTTRILAPLLNEAMLLLEEGASIEEIDRALKNFGFPVGPVALLDEVGIDVGAHVAHDLGIAFRERWGTPSSGLDQMVKAGYLGKKNGKGFYTADKKPNDAVYEFFGRPPRKVIDSREIAERVAFMMVGESIHCLQEGVIACARDGDIGAIMGLGFPPFLGGPFHYVDSVGAAAMARKMRDFAERFGPRFKPATMLDQLGEKRFYEISLS